MKTTNKILLLFLLLTTFFITACDEFDDYYYDDRPPDAPRNIYTITGDNRIDIFWDENYEDDIAGYNVYYSFSYDGRYTLIGSTYETYYIDNGAENGVTYYYAVAAYDYNGNESELSYDVIYDTPRPEGFNQAVFDYNVSPNNSGYDFGNYQVVPYNSLDADFFFENYNGIFYLNVWEDSDIQDMGQTTDIYDISYAPLTGWVPLQPNENIKYTEAKVGNTYVVWTWNNHFAKIRIKNITNERMVFDWAYQTAEGNRELKRSNVNDERSKLPGSVLKNR